MRELLEQLGVDWRQEAEVAHCYGDASGQFYLGWFHCVAELLDGPDAAVPVSPSGWHIVTEPLNEVFSVGFSRELGLVSECFKGQPLLQIEFTARVPWVLDEEPPE